MKRVYTRTGDRGTTGIVGGSRVPKDDIRIEANGSLDELNALVGVIRAMLSEDDEWQGLLHDVQAELMVVMSHVATPAGVSNPRVLHTDSLTLRMEQEMDKLTAAVPDPPCFILPGGTLLSATLHLARTVARRAERRLWTLNREQALEPTLLSFVNRLSDLFYVMSRAAMHRQGYKEERCAEVKREKRKVKNEGTG